MNKWIKKSDNSIFFHICDYCDCMFGIRLYYNDGILKFYHIPKFDDRDKEGTALYCFDLGETWSGTTKPICLGYDEDYSPENGMFSIIKNYKPVWCDFNETLELLTKRFMRNCYVCIYNLDYEHYYLHLKWKKLKKAYLCIIEMMLKKSENIIRNFTAKRMRTYIDDERQKVYGV